MTDPTAAPKNEMGRAKELLEMLLGGATIIYALGYAAWAWYSWEYQLGMPPALESQYFVAGGIPALIVLITFLALAALRALRGRQPTEQEDRRAKWMAKVAAVLVGGTFISNMLDAPTVGFWLFIAGTALFLVAIFLSRSETDRQAAKTATWGLAFVSVIVALVLFMLYSSRVFPKLPVELGGPRPQCVTVDVDTRAVSPVTVLHMTGRARSPDSTVALVRSKPLQLLAQNDPFLFAPDDTTIRGRVFRVREGAIAGVFRDTACACRIANRCT
jgi:hypothetical protein